MEGLAFRQNPRTAGRVIDGLAFVITPDDSKLHALNRTGTRIWELAGDGCTLEQVAEMLARQFAVEAPRARADAEQFCMDLVQRGILVRGPD